MIILIKTEKDSIDYKIDNLNKETTNDEISRAIMYLESIKLELLKNINNDYEVFEND